MEETRTPTRRRPVRRRKTPMDIFNEAYLPYLILFVAAIFIIFMIFAAIARSNAEDAAVFAIQSLQEV